MFWAVSVLIFVAAFVVGLVVGGAVIASQFAEAMK